MKNKSIRLNKYLSDAGYCSRRIADKLIEQGRVTINGTIAKIGTKVNIEDLVHVDDKKINRTTDSKTYLAFNKPKGVVCTTDTRVEKDNIVDFIGYHKRIFPIGRLDKQSEGLILLTDDGDIVNKILRARNNHEKEYLVSVNKPISQTFIHRMTNGIPILGTTTKKCEVKKIHATRFKIILTQGLNRQIRRMCEYLNYKVIHLQRIRIMNIKLDVPLGSYRKLTNSELKVLYEMLSGSSKNATV